MDDTIDFEAVVRSCAFVPHIKADTKKAVIEELIDALDAQGMLPDREEALQVVMAREATMSTGLQHGVALPHGKSKTVSSMVAAFGLKPEGIDFSAMDGEPSRLFVLVVSPVVQASQHIQFLGLLGRFLMCPAVRDKLMKVKTIDQVADTLMET